MKRSSFGKVSLVYLVEMALGVEGFFRSLKSILLEKHGKVCTPLDFEVAQSLWFADL